MEITSLNSFTNKVNSMFLTQLCVCVYNYYSKVYSLVVYDWSLLAPSRSTKVINRVVTLIAPELECVLREQQLVILVMLTA